MATEFTEKSADAAVATMIPSSTVNHMPTMTGGKGTAGRGLVRRAGRAYI